MLLIRWLRHTNWTSMTADPSTLSSCACTAKPPSVSSSIPANEHSNTKSIVKFWKFTNTAAAFKLKLEIHEHSLHNSNSGNQIPGNQLKVQTLESIEDADWRIPGNQLKVQAGSTLEKKRKFTIQHLSVSRTHRTSNQTEKSSVASTGPGEQNGYLQFSSPFQGNKLSVPNSSLSVPTHNSNSNGHIFPPLSVSRSAPGERGGGFSAEGSGPGHRTGGRPVWPPAPDTGAESPPFWAPAPDAPTDSPPFLLPFHAPLLPVPDTRESKRQPEN